MLAIFFKIFPIILYIIAIIVPLILVVAYLTYFERKIIGLMQRRVGPSVVGPMGLLQPIADALKLVFKEMIIPAASDRFGFIIAPMIVFTLSMIGWAVIPFDKGMVLANINVGVLYILAISALNVYGIIIGGWASNSKFAFLAAIRSSAQMISYELAIGMIVAIIALTSGSLNLTQIVESSASRPFWLEILLAPLAVVFFTAMLAETNRHPFDMPEAESELVAGYNVEYSSMGFALFFLGEYANMILASAMTAIFFLGGYLPPFGIKFLTFIPGFVWFILKISFLLFCFIWIRATLPRYRYDQLMSIGWKVFLPMTVIWLILISSLLFFTNQLPDFVA
ncbi:MAG: NADH-quinone oxidoreductase subunit NuoH [Rickettsiaceae bacterium]|nr:NADH-quinone oxidoreductase subunit NuoH [Rickettsiaceae bacterium]